MSIRSNSFIQYVNNVPSITIVSLNHRFSLMLQFAYTLYSTSKTWSLGPAHDPAWRGSDFNGFASTGGELFWSAGVLEYWSVGKNESPNLTYFGPFITPLLHRSITPADYRKGERVWKPPQGAVQSWVLWVRILY